MKRSILYFLLAAIFVYGCGDGLKGMESDYTIKISGADQLPFSGHYTIAGTGALPKPVQVTGKGSRGIHRQRPGGGLRHSKNDFRRHVEGGNHSRERCRFHCGNRGTFWGHHPWQNPGYHFHHQSAHREDIGLGGKHLTINLNTMQKVYTCSELSSYLLSQ